jgi:hypothetical protein
MIRVQVSKKVFVTLPDSVHEDLERWANLQGRPTANLAAFLIETGINQAREKGDLPLKNETPTTSSSAKGRGKKVANE